ncbi:hypothetical protein F383_27623 [Gossypium arboreum]|uniref:Uncharacterized protein n=1 Tax=Gossypium arboreum TaxID=29729 RepID=A0A0B0N1V1_GOSAR|nr:hypothetical protein F383_28808 [Gossypium arboreum]KHG05161.1 hypothetical protein F383_31042 [Gossypium arboreum]KHG21311.1 hypothetical protein F383_27623 [Gossypium arboreum]
MSEVRGSVYLK